MFPEAHLFLHNANGELRPEKESCLLCLRSSFVLRGRACVRACVCMFVYLLWTHMDAKYT